MKINNKRSLALTVAAFSLFATAAVAFVGTSGCGGGSGHGTSESAGAGRSVQVRVKWPARASTRLIPVAAESLHIEIRTREAASESVVTRDIARGQEDIIIDRLPAGDLVLLASALDANKKVVARGQADFSAQVGQPAQVALSLDSAITLLVVSPTGSTLRAKQTRPLTDLVTVSGINADGDTVMVAPARLQWTLDPGAASGAATLVEGDKLHGNREGTAQLLVTDSESGKTGSTPLAVGPIPAQLVFVRQDRAYVINDDGSNERFITKFIPAPINFGSDYLNNFLYPFMGRYITPLYDGSGILFSAIGSSGPQSIFYINMDGTGMRKVSNFDSSPAVFGPVVDRTGKYYISLKDEFFPGGYAGEMGGYRPSHWAFTSTQIKDLNGALVTNGVTINAANFVGGWYEFTPDSTHIVAGTKYLPVTSSDTSPSSEPFTLTHGARPGFSPDGSRVTYELMAGGQNAVLGAVYVVNTDGSGERRLTTPPAGQIDIEPRFSPDGSRIAFTRYPNGNPDGGQIYIMEADGSDLHLLTNGVLSDWCKQPESE